MRASMLTGAAAATTALAIVLTGCGSDSKPAASSSSSESSTTSSKPSESKTSTSKAAPTPAAAGDQSIADYLNANGGGQNISPGQDGAPDVALPNVDGWDQIAQGELPAGSYGGIRYAGADVTDFPPAIYAYLLKGSADIDPATILEIAPNELQSLPGWTPAAEGEMAQLGGQDSYRLAGENDQDGVRMFVAQQTVVIPGADALYVLQLNGYAPPDSVPTLGDALSTIDAETTIG